jgi:nucleic acid-binding domain protein
MKKLFILGIALSLFISCAKEDNAGIPPVNQGQIPSQKQLTTLEADKATVADYVAGKKAKIHGKIVKDGNFSYFKFSDGTLVQIYAATDVVNALPQEKKTKLNTAGQEITVTGTFKDYTLKSSGKVIKELVYENENDLVFGQEGTPQEVVNLEAATATASDYVVGKKVKLHGTVGEVQGNKSFFKFSDGTLVQIFTPKFKELSQETNNKLRTVGQEITVTGTFTDHTKDGETIKEILYNSESDLVFGAASNTPQQPVVTLEAATATASDYVAEKEVKIHGTIVRDGNHSYFKFSDNTMIQIYVVKSVFDLLSQEDKTKFATSGQEVTVTGKFKDFKPKNSNNVIKEIECTSKDNLVFGATPNNPQPQPQPQPSQGGVFDFEDLTIPSDPKKASNYSTEGTLTKDGVTLQYKARTSLKQDQTDFSIEGKGLMLTNHKNQNCYIKITFPNGVKEISFDYKTAFAAGQREIILSKDESGQEKIDEFSFNDSTKKTHTIQINATGTYTFYILAKNNTRQFVIDNIKWTN